MTNTLYQQLVKAAEGEQTEELRKCNCGNLPVWEERKPSALQPRYVEKRLICKKCHVYTWWCYRRKDAIREWNNPEMPRI